MNVRLQLLSVWFFCSADLVLAFMPPGNPPLPDYDKRVGAVSVQAPVSQEQKRAVERLQAQQPRATVDFDPITGGPKSVSAGSGYLNGSNGVGGNIPAATASRFAANDPDRATKAFLLEHRELFRHGPEVLNQARVKQQFVTPHNGLRTVVWQQEVDGIAVFGAVLISHTSRLGELVNISSQFLPDAVAAVQRGGFNRADLGAPLNVPARRAVAIAANEIGEQLSEAQVETNGVGNLSPLVPDPERRQVFHAQALQGRAEAKLIWLPVSPEQVRLCWDVILTSRTRGEMFRILVDARSGEPLLRRCLTEYISDATYRVYSSDSPSPLSPGNPTPTTNQPPLVPRTLLTISALDTNASPGGWIDDGVNETRGNNVDAHADLDADDEPDLPRPQGAPFRVFDFPLDLSSAPDTYRDAAVVQLFYWCNWMHDELYGLGFTEQAGNFQEDNFGRGGLGSDAIQADAQDGGGMNNANFSTPPDGSPGRMQMFIFNGPLPARDDDLDAEIILHEYTHGLSNRRVGGGVGINALQSRCLGEGWSDFYALACLTKPADDVHGVYAFGAYSAYSLVGLKQNYYFGIRRYPYCTDLGKSPLTFKDIDPTQASSHSGIPRNPVIGTTADEVHNSGELWCAVLWEARANLIRKYGWAAGNKLILQLVTDGMALSPPDPNFLQARDAILQADLLDSGGANRNELWSAFAKRGMGVHATCPDSSTSVGLYESFEVPDDLQVSPSGDTSFAFQSGFVPSSSCQVYFLSNTGSNTMNWIASMTESWVKVEPASGSVSPGGFNAAIVCLTAEANTLPGGDYSSSITFSNTASGVTQTRSVILHLSPPRMLYFSLDTQPDWSRTGDWSFGKSAGLGGTVNGNPDPATAASGTNVFGVNLNGDYSLVVGEAAYLTAGPFDFSGYTGTGLQFQRWLNTDFQPYVYATIELSFDGTHWNPVWDNGTSEIADHGWTAVSYDLSALADNRTNVYVRWGHRVASQLAFAYSGWNLDDIELVGNPSRRLTVGLPPLVNVATGMVTGFIAASPAPATDLIVALASSDPSAVAVPASVIVPAGQSNVLFSLTVANHLAGPGMQTVLIRATAPDYVAGSSFLDVLDNATATLDLVLPGTATEGEGSFEGTVSIHHVQTNALTIQLSSSDTNALKVPESVFIPVGQTSAVFVTTVVDDGLIDGPQTAVITAHFPGWVDAARSIAVQDNENVNLKVTAPASVWENSGLLPNAGSVSMSGALTTNLTLFLASSEPGRLSVPASVTILAGQVTNTFDLSTVDNAIGESNRMITIEASAPGFSNGIALIAFLDDEIPPIPSHPSPSDLATNVVQTSGLAWQSGILPDGMITNDVYFGTNPTPGAGELVGSTTNQSWTLPLLAPQTRYYWQIVARRVGLVQGPVWQFMTRGVDHFAWSAIASPQFTNVPFLATITAADADGNAVQGFNGTVALSGSSGTGTVAVIQCLPPVSGTFTNGVWSGEIALLDRGKNVRLKADDSNGHAGFSAPFEVAAFNLPATVISPPTNQVAAIGATVTFSVVADGTPPLSYLWSFNSTNLLETTNSLLILTNVQLSAAGDYAVQVTNVFGSATSSNAVLMVGESPTIIVQPTNRIARLGDTAAFEGGATGTSPLNYQWSVGGTNFTNATNSLLMITNAQLSDAGSYAVRVSNLFGTATSSNALLTVGLPPTIAVQPTNLTVLVGEMASFGAVASGSAPLSYHWRFNSTNLLDATNSLLVISNVQVSAAGDYAMQVSSPFGSVESSNAVLVVGEPSRIVSHPTNQVVRLGDNAIFEVGAVGTAPLHYQWSLGGTNLLDETNSLLVITHVEVSDAGSYAVRASNAFGFENSSNAVLTIGVAPVILAQPTNLAVSVGGVASFSLAARGTAPLGYQWIFNGTNLLGATNSLLVITNVQMSDAGNYAAQVTNVFGTETSSNAVLLVGEPSRIVVQPTNQVVRLGEMAAFEVGATGTAPLRYQWSFEGTNLVYGTNNLLVITNVQLSDAGSYAVRVTNAFGLENSSNALLTIGMPPDISVQPTNRSVAVGAVAAFSIVASGTSPLSYQWSFNGTNLLNATSSLLVITNVQMSNAGNYAVQVTNAYGSETSSNAALEVHVPPPLCNLAPAGLVGWWAAESNALDSARGYHGSLTNGATFGPGKVGTAFLFAGGTNGINIGDPDLLRLTNSFSIEAWIWIAKRPPAAQGLGQILFRGDSRPCLDPYFLGVLPGGALRFHIADELDSLGCGVNLGTSAVATQQWVHVAAVLNAASGAMQVYLDGQLAAETNTVVRPFGTLTNGGVAIGNRSAGDISEPFEGLIDELAVYDRALSANEIQSIVSSGASGKCSLPPSFLLQPTNQTVGPGFAAIFRSVATGTPPLSFQWQFNGTNLANATNEVLAITNAQLSDAGSYAVQVSNGSGSLTSSNALLIVMAAPAFVSQPTNQEVKLGDGAAFAATAIGSQPFHWQWSLDSTNLLNATNSLLEITNVQLSDAGLYAVQVSNAFGLAKSSNALLKIALPPAILLQPTNQFLLAGGIGKFTVGAAGTPPLIYQWRRGGTNLADDGRILGASSSELTISNLAQADVGPYSAVVSNRWGSVLSANATLLLYVIDRFAWDPIPSPKFVNVPFPVRIQALDATNNRVTNFTGNVVLTSTSGVSVLPPVSGSFVLGEWTGSVSAAQAGTGTVLIATDSAGHWGYANPINVFGVPSLSVLQARGTLLFSWSADSPGYSLETSHDLSNWTSVAAPRDLIGDKYEIPLRIPATNAFYRLRFEGP